MPSIDAFAEEKLTKLQDQSLFRTIQDSDRTEGAKIQRNGRELISFCCNDYLGLSQHPAVKEAAIKAIDRYGLGAGASRLVTGSNSLYRTLENRLATLKGSEDACVMGSGYLVNSGTIPTFASEGDIIFIDALAHSCLYAGSHLSGADITRFAHNDMAQLDELLSEQRNQYRRCLIVTEGVFSMDGDLAPLDRLTELTNQHDAWLVSDDAHGFGVVGDDGCGSAFAHDGPVDITLHTGTLSKAVGAYGGYVCGSKPVIDLIRNRARTLIYSTGLPPAVVAAALAALDLIKNDPALRGAPLRKARIFAEELGLPEPQSTIIPLIVGDAETALQLSQKLEDQGFLISAIRPPTVPPGTARLRVTFSAAHRDEDVLGLASEMRKLGFPDLLTSNAERSVA